MAKVQSGFSPQENGFRFTNYFEFDFPIRYPLPFSNAVELKNVVFGLCGGMCFAALDYFHNHQALPATQDVKSIDRKLFAYLCQRQLDSLTLPILLKIIEWMLSEDAALARMMTKTEIPRLRRSLDKHEPVVLCLIRVRGVKDPTKNHQVLATGYTIDPDTGLMTIDLYDPNHPGKEASISLSAGPDSVLLQQSTGEPLRAIFIVPYRRCRTLPVPSMERHAPPNIVDGSRSPGLPFVLQWPVDSRNVNQYFGENPKYYKVFHQAGHEGIDFYAPTGANIYAAYDGEVYEAQVRGEYGLQVRIKHQANSIEFKTIYAHLKNTVVKPGQIVRAGDLLGLADNTGNSFGSHLHFTLKVKGVKTPGYPAEIVDPWPYFRETAAFIRRPLESLSGVTVITSEAIHLRTAPDQQSEAVAVLPSGEVVPAFGEAESVRAMIGKQDQWLRVRTASGATGYVAAWLVVDSQHEAFPPTGLIVYPANLINLRSGPGTMFETISTLPANTPLNVLGSLEGSQGKIGRHGEWLMVQSAEGQRGFVAAWLVHRTGEAARPSGMTVYPTVTLNVRARPAPDANILTVVQSGESLAALGDPSVIRSNIGQQESWINVQTSDRFTGFVAAWLVSDSPGSVDRPSDGFVVYPTADLNLRAQPSINSQRVNGAFMGESLKVIDSDMPAAREKVGKPDCWLFVERQGGVRGWAAAWYLSETPES